MLCTPRSLYPGKVCATRAPRDLTLLNPLRWIEGALPPLEQVMRTMRERAARFNVDKVRQEDLVGVAGPPEEAE